MVAMLARFDIELFISFLRVGSILKSSELPCHRSFQVMGSC
jgi:hypothetical protein